MATRTINFYKEGNLWIVDKTITPAGSYRMKNNGDDHVSIIDFEGKIIFSGYTTDILDSSGNGYSDYESLIAAVSDFFVNAPVDGGYHTISKSVSGTASIQLEFGKATINSNTLTSTDIITLTLATTTSTEIGEYIYSFTTGATAPTIVWPIECKESIVISPNKKYLISFVRVSATKVFTFIDEEVV